MAIHRDNTEERQARLEMLIDRYRDSQKRRAIKRATALWKRTEMDAAWSPGAGDIPDEKLN